jgi:hypothetical protein
MIMGEPSDLSSDGDGVVRKNALSGKSVTVWKLKLLLTRRNERWRPNARWAST